MAEGEQVVTADSSILLRLAFAFLAVCLINTVGILLAKFLKRSPVTGLLRALGASRRQIFRQQSSKWRRSPTRAPSPVSAWRDRACGDAGRLVQDQQLRAAGPFRSPGVGWALALAALSTLAAGLYPAWSIGRLPPSVYLKSR